MRQARERAIIGPSGPVPERDVSEPSQTPGIDVVRRRRSSVEGLGEMIEGASGLNHITTIAHDETTRLRAMLALRRGRRSDRTQLQEPGNVHVGRLYRPWQRSQRP
jgi:hypothetical protein